MRRATQMASSPVVAPAGVLARHARCPFTDQQQASGEHMLVIGALATRYAEPGDVEVNEEEAW